MYDSSSIRFFSADLFKFLGHENIIVNYES